MSKKRETDWLGRMVGPNQEERCCRVWMDENIDLCVDPATGKADLDELVESWAAQSNGAEISDPEHFAWTLGREAIEKHDRQLIDVLRVREEDN